MITDKFNSLNLIVFNKISNCMKLKKKSIYMFKNMFEIYIYIYIVRLWCFVKHRDVV
jgi:hypothetical protein